MINQPSNEPPTQLTPTFISNCLQSTQNRTETLTTIFQTLHLTNQNKKNPGLYTTEIAQNISSKMAGRAKPPNRVGFPPDAKTLYPVNKAGAIGVLERQCCVLEKGIEQREDGKAAKLIQIVGYKNQIQTEKSKNNEKLDWIKDNKAYPFRIIIRDKDNKIKALYFKTAQQAQRIRLFYWSKFTYKGNFKKIMQQSNRRYTAKLAQNMKFNLTRYITQKQSKQRQQRLKNKITLTQPRKSTQSNQPSQPRQSKPAPIPSIKSPSSNPNPNPKRNIFNQQPELQPELDDDRPLPIDQHRGGSINPNVSSRGQKGYSSDLMRSMIDREQGRKSSGGLGVEGFGDSVRKLNDACKRNLFQTWHKKAKQAKQSQPVRPPKSRIYQTLTSKPPQSQSNPRTNPAPAPTTPQSLHYKSIQFLHQTNIFIKPIILISLRRQNTTEHESKFNTIIQRKDPHLAYELVINSGQPSHTIKGNINEYEINVRAIDYLTNSEICHDRILLKERVVTRHMLLINRDRSVRVEIVYEGGSGGAGGAGGRELRFEENPQGNFLEIKGLSQGTIQEIRGFWEKQSVRRGYYNISKDIKILQILQLCSQPPKFWSIGLTDSIYHIVTLLTSASHILSFKLTQSILPILAILTQLYTDLSQLIEITLSIIVNYMRTYYFPSEFNRTNRLHSVLNFVGEMDLSSKIGLEIEVVKRIVGIECGELVEVFARRNIVVGHLLYEYVYEMFARCFHLKVLVELWNFLFKDVAMIPIYMILISAWLIKFYQPKLKKCFRFRQVAQILQSHQTCHSQILIRDLLTLREKYFNTTNTIMDSLKQIFNTNPLEQVVIEFYKRETERLDQRKENRLAEKNAVLQRLCAEGIAVEVPVYPSRVYCLHVYFYRVPHVAGSLYIKANNIEYQCLNLPKTRYFIIPDIHTDITLQFINTRSDSYTCKLQCIKGINRYTAQLKSPKSGQSHRVEYLCGLLTDSHIEVLKKNRKFEHYIGAYMRQQELFDQFLRPVGECAFLNGYAKRLDRDQLGKKIKVVFSTGNKNFDEIQFYLRWIYVSPITLPQKLALIKQYSIQISQQHFLTPSLQLYRHFLQLFLKMTQLHLTPSQFLCYYSDSLQFEFQSPKIAKCRLTLPNNTEYKLEEAANRYLAGKASTHLYADVLIGDFLACLDRELVEMGVGVGGGVGGQLVEGVVGLVYASYGEVSDLELPIVRKKTSKELVVDQSKFQQEMNESNDINMAQPQILLTQVLPTFSKISTILDFVNNSKSIESLGRTKQQKPPPEPLNLLKLCDPTLTKTLPMRYYQHPQTVHIPFLNYYHELICDAVPPHFPKNIFLNNLQTDIKTICLYEGNLSFSDNRRIQSTGWDRGFGLYGNLRVLAPKTEGLYFTTVMLEEVRRVNGLVFVNYGFGIYRWQPCIALGYTYIKKQKSSNLTKQKRPKKYILIRHQNFQKFYKDFQVRLDPKISQSLPYIETKTSPSMKASTRKPGEVTPSRRQVGSLSGRGGRGGGDDD